MDPSRNNERQEGFRQLKRSPERLANVGSVAFPLLKLWTSGHLQGPCSYELSYWPRLPSRGDVGATIITPDTVFYFRQPRVRLDPGKQPVRIDSQVFERVPQGFDKRRKFA